MCINSEVLLFSMASTNLRRVAVMMLMHYFTSIPDDKTFAKSPSFIQSIGISDYLLVQDILRINKS